MHLNLVIEKSRFQYQRLQKCKAAQLRHSKICPCTLMMPVILALWHLNYFYYNPWSSQPQHVKSSQRVPQLIWQLEVWTGRWRKPCDSPSPSSLAPIGVTSSGCSVVEWIPYACKHSLMNRAWFINFVRDSSEVRTWAVAKALFWLRRHACNSCIDTTPSTYIVLVLQMKLWLQGIRYLRNYLFEIVFHIVNIYT